MLIPIDESAVAFQAADVKARTRHTQGVERGDTRNVARQIARSIPLTAVVNGVQDQRNAVEDGVVAHNQSVYITHFEEQLEALRDTFCRNYRHASEKF